MEKDVLQTEDLKFKGPAYGPSLYWEAGVNVLKHGYCVPTGFETARLLHAVYCEHKGDKSMLDSILTQRQPVPSAPSNTMPKFLWVFNRNIWTEEGVYVINDQDLIPAQIVQGKHNNFCSKYQLEPLIRGGRHSDEGVISSPDERVTFIPHGQYASGCVDAPCLANDNLVIANYSPKGAQLLAAVAATFPEQPYLGTFETDMICGIETKVASLAGLDNKNVKRLVLNTTSLDGTIGRGSGGFAFGVLRRQTENH